MKIPPRETQIQALRQRNECDVLIVGGGINGAGLLRELALNQVDAVLIDQSDFAAGATSASSRMIHGGLRYLENGEFRLVREALIERNRLLRNAPHAVKPLPTTIPIYSTWAGFLGAAKKFFGMKAKPSQRGSWLIRIGLCMYDFYVRKDRTLPKHYFSTRRAALEKHPMLDSKIKCTATYFDAWIPLPERLCIEVIDDAFQLSSSVLAIPYVKLDGVAPGGGLVVLRDQVDGSAYSIAPKLVVNATGGWIDATNAALAIRRKMIGGTKGSHLVLVHDELRRTVGDHQIFFENADGRICLCFALHDCVLAGTTDIRVASPDEAKCDEAEIEYILQSIRNVFPSIKVGCEHIRSYFCGVRPLPVSDTGTTGQISRDHSLTCVAPSESGLAFPVYSMVGGKWTTFRAFGEQTADKLLAILKLPRISSSQDRSIGDPNANDTCTTQDGIASMVREQCVTHLDDFVLRRSRIGLYEPLDEARIRSIAEAVGGVLGWSPARLAEEIARTKEILRSQHGVDLLGK
jgi:glycerol-3-phosphate dehydrogenase